MMKEAAMPTNSMPKGETKRGRMESVETKPMYDENDKVTGYNVRAKHEPAKTGTPGEPMMYPSPIETPHESLESAMAKHEEHVRKNAEDYKGAGDKGKSKDERKADDGASKYPELRRAIGR